jgi:hypothetical protein
VRHWVEGSYIRCMTRTRTCFVLIPFKESFKEVYEKAYRHVCKKNNLDCWRVDEKYTPGQITEEIVKGIISADIVIADLTDKNPNVFYELGIAHAATHNKTILVSRRAESLPFDIGHYGVIFYDNTYGGIIKLRSELEKAIQILLSKQYSAQHPVRSTVLALLSEEIAPEIGLSSFRSSFHGFSYKELMEKAFEMLIILNDGRSWIDSYRELLQFRAKNHKKTWIILIHPRSEFLPVLIKKNGKQRTTQLDELRRSFDIINELRKISAAIDIRGHHLFNPYSLIITEDQASVMPYFYNESGDLPMLTFSNTGEGSLYNRYRTDAYALYNGSESLTENDFLFG